MHGVIVIWCCVHLMGLFNYFHTKYITFCSYNFYNSKLFVLYNLKKIYVGKNINGFTLEIFIRKIIWYWTNSYVTYSHRDLLKYPFIMYFRQWSREVHFMDVLTQWWCIECWIMNNYRFGVCLIRQYLNDTTFTSRLLLSTVVTDNISIYIISDRFGK